MGISNHTTPFPQLRSLSSSNEVERFKWDALLSLQYRKGSESPVSDPLREMTYFTWLDQRIYRVPGSPKMHLYLDDYLQRPSATITAVYHFNNHPAPSDPPNPEWGLTSQRRPTCQQGVTHRNHEIHTYIIPKQPNKPVQSQSLRERESLQVRQMKEMEKIDIINTLEETKRNHCHHRYLTHTIRNS